MEKPIALAVLEVLIKALLVVGAVFLAFISAIFDLAKESK